MKVPNTDLLTDNGFRCLVLDKEKKVDFNFSTLDLTDLADVKLNVFEEIPLPDGERYHLQCIGGASPDPGATKTLNFTAKWVDNSPMTPVDVQIEIAPIEYPEDTLIVDST